MQILLNDDITACREVGIFIAYESSSGQSQAGRVGRVVDKAQKVTRGEIAKARNFVDDGHAVAEIVEQNAFKFEAQIGTFRSNMERRSPGVDGATWAAPSIRANRLSSCGRWSK